MTRIFAVIPVKSFARAKTRLAECLSAPARVALARAMASDVIAAATQARAVETVFALASDAHTAAWAARRRATPLPEGPRTSLSRVIARAVDTLAARGADVVIYLASDLPGLTRMDIERLLDAHRGGLTIAAASRDDGTNAFVCDTPRPIAFAFGPGSAARHLARARQAGLRTTRVNLPAFARDIDTAADLAVLRGRPRSRRSATPRGRR